MEPPAWKRCLFHHHELNPTKLVSTDCNMQAFGRSTSLCLVGYFGILNFRRGLAFLFLHVRCPRGVPILDSVPRLCGLGEYLSLLFLASVVSENLQTNSTVNSAAGLSKSS